jgi:hypothetical protein
MALKNLLKAMSRDGLERDKFASRMDNTVSEFSSEARANRAF